MTANGILVGDGREESDVILVGKVLSFVENKTSLETNYLVEVEKYLKTPKNYDTNTKTVTVISPGLRQYDDPQQTMIYDKIFNIDDRVLFLLYQKDGILVESLYSQTTKSNCSPKQLLDEMYGETGLHISQNNQSRHFYTNQPVDLTYYGYNRDLMAEKKDFEFKVNVPKTGQILSEKTQLDFQECKRTASASWNFTPTVAGRYAFHSIIGNNEGGSEAFSGFLIEDYVDSPLKQFKAGIHLEYIRCKESLILVTKYDDSPACVKPETRAKLIDRLWTQSYAPSEVRCSSGVFPYIPKNWQSTGMHPSDETWENLGRQLMKQFFFKELQERNIVFEPACFGVYTGFTEESYPARYSMCSIVTASNGTNIYLEGTIREFDVDYFDIDNKIPYQCDDNHFGCLCGIENEN